MPGQPGQPPPAEPAEPHYPIHSASGCAAYSALLFHAWRCQPPVGAISAVPRQPTDHNPSQSNFANLQRPTNPQSSHLALLLTLAPLGAPSTTTLSDFTTACTPTGAARPTTPPHAGQIRLYQPPSTLTRFPSLLQCFN